MCNNIPHSLRRVKVVAAMKKTIDMETQKCYRNKQTSNVRTNKFAKVQMELEKKKLTGSVSQMASSLIVSSSPGMSVLHILQEGRSCMFNSHHRLNETKQDESTFFLN